MSIEHTNILGCELLIPHLISDNRGYFYELWNKKTWSDIDLNYDFVQDNISASVKGVLRGVHTQLKYPQAKIVGCLKGAIYDVVVDCRPNSPTFEMWHGEVLNQENHKVLLIPEGVAHGYYTIEDAIVYMKVSTHYTQGDEVGFLWNDEKIGISWPVEENLILAEKDKNWTNFDQMMQIIWSYR